MTRIGALRLALAGAAAFIGARYFFEDHDGAGYRVVAAVAVITMAVAAAEFAAGDDRAVIPRRVWKIAAVVVGVLLAAMAVERWMEVARSRSSDATTTTAVTDSAYTPPQPADTSAADKSGFDVQKMIADAKPSQPSVAAARKPKPEPEPEPEPTPFPSITLPPQSYGTPSAQEPAQPPEK